MYIDSHAHLDGPRFDSDRDQVIARARAAGVSTILAIGIGAFLEDVPVGARLK